MRGSLKYFAAAVGALGIMAGATLLAWTDNFNAQWQLWPTFAVDRVHFVIRHSSAFGGWSNGRDVPLDNFRGFSLAMLAAGGPAKFEYVGDAGRLLCEGRFGLGTGSGSFTFKPNPDFARELARMGYDAPDEDQLFSMLVQNVDRQFARDVHDAGLKASSGQLIDLQMNGVDSRYIRDVRRAGYTNLDVENYVQLKINGVSAGYLQRLHDSGYANLRAEEITQLQINGVQPRLFQEARRLGYNFTTQELTDLQINGVTPNYLQTIKDSGMRNLTAAQITKLRINGVE